MIVKAIFHIDEISKLGLLLKNVQNLTQPLRCPATRHEKNSHHCSKKFILSALAIL
jgi:hypothetical protein